MPMRSVQLSATVERTQSIVLTWFVLLDGWRDAVTSQTPPIDVDEEGTRVLIE